MSSTSNKICCKCIKPLRKIHGSVKVINTLEEALTARDQLQIELSIGDSLCDKCRRLVFFGTKWKNVDKPEENEPVPSTSTISEERITLSESQKSLSPSLESSFQSQTSLTTSLETSSQGSSQDPSFRPTSAEKIGRPNIELPLKRTISTHRICFICRKTTLCTVIPIEARLKCFSKTKIFIPQGNHICSKHLINQRIYEDELQNIECYSNTSFIFLDELSLFMQRMANSAETSLFGKVGSLEISEERVKVLTGLSYAQN